MPRRLDHQRRPERARCGRLSPRPEKCCDGAAVMVSSPSGSVVRLPPVELGDALGRHAPRLEVRADAERGDERHARAARARGSSGSRGGRSGRARRCTASSGGSARSGTGTGWKRFGPANATGEARSPHTGSVSTRSPSISSSTVEWPSHVARSPLAVGWRHASSGLTDGSGREGTRRPSAQRKSRSEGKCTDRSRRPGKTGWRLRNPTPSQTRRSAHAIETQTVLRVCRVTSSKSSYLGGEAIGRQLARVDVPQPGSRLPLRQFSGPCAPCAGMGLARPGQPFTRRSR